ncbi:MAG TPA: efflux RND transporter permease subunit, partial [Steroidobacteraceae bacterium]
SDGLAFTYIEFNASTDADSKYDEVQREVNALRPELPAEVQKIEIRRVSPGLVNIVQVALVSADASYRELEDYARTLKDQLKTLDGVRTAESWAYPARELRVQLDQQRMAQMGLRAQQVMQALQSENADISAGAIDAGARSFSLKTLGSYKNLDQIRDTVIATSGSRIVRVRDVAEVGWDTQTWAYVGRFNGKRAVFVTANQKDGYNILKVSARVDVAVQRFEQGLPKRIHLERGFDQSHNVAGRLDHLYRDLLIAIGLVLLTLLPLGVRAAGIVMLAIPLSFAFGLTALNFLGYSLNQISIAGFVVALGLLVDDSIVVTENIARHLREGASRAQAALAGTRQIAVAIIGCTATLIFAFVPLVALPGNPGKFIRVLPVTVIATIVGSLAIALFIIPFIASRVLREQAGGEGNALLQRVMGAIHRYYRPALHYCLARPRATAVTAIGGALLLSAALVPVVGSSLFPKADTPQFLVTVQAPDGASLADTNAALHFVEQRLAQMPAVKSWFANLGHGNPQIYYNVVPHGEAVNYAEVFVQLTRYDTRRTPRELDGLRVQLARYPGAHIYVKEFVNGPPITAPISVRVIGPDVDVIEHLAARVERLIQQTPGTRDVDNPLRVARTNLQLAIDPQKAAQ